MFFLALAVVGVGRGLAVTAETEMLSPAIT